MNRLLCSKSRLDYLPPELYIMFSNILHGAVHMDSIFLYFMTHAKKVFPHLECLPELKLVSDLTNPPNWYPTARSWNRKIIFHSGPTNSGKTHQALARFMSAKSGVYCGPLKLLSSNLHTGSILGHKIDYYNALGVHRSADQQAIKVAYFRQAKKFHPDYNNSPSAAPMFDMISEAYEVLSDPQKRENYDEYGTPGESFGGMTQQGPGRKRSDNSYTSEDLFKQFFKQGAKGSVGTSWA